MPPRTLHDPKPGAVFQLSAHPALLLFGSLAAGCWVHGTYGHPGAIAWTVLSLSAAVLAKLWAVRSRGQFVSTVRLFHYVAAALVAFGAGGLRSSQFATIERDHVLHLVQDTEPRVCYGKVVTTPAQKRGRSRFVLALDSIAVDGTAPATRATGRIYVSIRSSERPPWTNDVRSGSIVRVHGALARPSPRRNPADFDFARYLRHRSILMTLYADSSASVEYLSAPANPLRLISSRLEQRAESAIENYLPTQNGRAVLSALLLGRRSEIDPSLLARFARTGLMHVLAVSGLHVLMVGMVIYALLGPLLLRTGIRWQTMELARTLTTLILLTLYAMVTGGSASVVRAVVMCAVLLGGVAVQRKAPPLNSLALAGCILLMARPTILWDVGFQLSFSAVAAIIVLQRPFAHHVQSRFHEGSWKAKLVQGTLVTTAATLGTAPVLLYHFGSTSTAGLLLNPVAIPATGLALSAGLLTVITLDVPLLAAGFGHAADALAHVLTITASTGDHFLGWARLRVRLTSTPHLVSFILALGALGTADVPRLRWRMAIGALAILTCGSWTRAILVARPDLQIVFFDVGQGDAALVRFPNQRHILVDMGPRNPYVDTGSRVLLPHLEWAGISRLDAVIVTHPHSDHLGGLPAVLRGIRVDQIYHNGEEYASRLFGEVTALSDSLGIPQRALEAGEEIRLDAEARIFVLAPSAAASIPTNANDRSIVLRIEYGTTAILLTGDAETQAEQLLVRRYRQMLAADVVKVGHHGSDTSSRLPFVRAVTRGKAPVAVVSVAAVNRFGLPDQRVLNRWSQSGAEVSLTSSVGAVWVRSNGERVEVVDWRRE